MIHSEGEEQVQTGAADDEALIEDIDHGYVREQPPPMTTASTLVLRRFTRDCQSLRRYHALKYVLLTFQVNHRAIRRYMIANKNLIGIRKCRKRWIL